MNWFNANILTLVTFLPLVGAFAAALLPGKLSAAIRVVAIVFASLTFVLSVVVLVRFEPWTDAIQFEVNFPWLTSPMVNYHLGVDGISIFLVLLTTVLVPIALLSAWRSVDRRVKEFSALMLLLETGILGVFLSLDMFLFFVFWELVLIPMYFIIGIWGGTRRVYASLKFFIYTALGSVFLLLAMIYIYIKAADLRAGGQALDIFRLYGLGFSLSEQRWLFLAMALAFAIKMPMFPFHTWLPDAHVEAPTAGSVILAAILLKMGSYGFLRFALPMFPLAVLEFLPWLAGLAAVGVVYGAMVAMVQHDLKKLVAYSSVSHMGVVMLGLLSLSVTGMTGSVYQMLAHGVATGGLFLVVGVLYERRHTREIAEYGGVASVAPGAAAVFMVLMLSSIGLPATAGFAGEFLSFLGAFTGPAFTSILAYGRWFVIAGLTGMVLGAVYMLYAYQKVMFGPLVKEENKRLKDLSLREVVVFLPVLALVLWLGVHTTFFTSRIEPSVARVAQIVLSAKGQASRPDPARVPFCMRSTSVGR